MHSEMGAARVPLRKKFLFMIAVVWWHLPAASVKAAAGGSPDEGHHVSLTLVIAGVATLSLVWCDMSAVVFAHFHKMCSWIRGDTQPLKTNEQKKNRERINFWNTTYFGCICHKVPFQKLSAPKKPTMRRFPSGEQAWTQHPRRFLWCCHFRYVLSVKLWHFFSPPLMLVAVAWFVCDWGLAGHLNFPRPVCKATIRPCPRSSSSFSSAFILGTPAWGDLAQ